ncbi:MAG: hypothetical protein Q8L14_41425 [Myxococcales bacterium]|nr:hypothetical protein [Myxococcales bacterium]
MPRGFLLVLVMTGCFSAREQRDALLFEDSSAGGGQAGAAGGGHSGGGSSTCPATDGTSWVARPLYVLASPIPDPTGVACAGDDLWLVNGGHNGQTHRLVRYNTVDGGISFDHTYTGLIETGGTGVYGLTTEGNSVWLSVSGNRNKLVEVDVATGATGRVIGSPSFLGPSDLETDGQSLIVSTGNGEVYRVTLDPVPRTSRLFKTWNIHDRDIGVAALGPEWLVAGLFGVLHTYSANGDFGGQVTLPGGAPFERALVGALCVQQNQLIMLGTAGIGVYELCNPRP